MDQIHQQLVESIKTQLSNGRNESDIRRDVISQGWTKAEYEEAIRIAQAILPPKHMTDLPPSPSLIRREIDSSEQSNPVSSFSIANLLYIIGSLVILAGIGYGVYYYLTVLKV